MEAPFKQRSLREAARQGAKPAVANPLPVPPCPVNLQAPVEAPPKPAKKSKKEKPKARVVVGQENLLHKCGHTAALELIEGEKPQTTENRRRSVGESRCPACREAARTARPANCDGRLPDGSAFAVAYSAATQTWSGSLTVGGTDPSLVLSGQASSVFQLLKRLDQQYRERKAAAKE